MSTNIFSVFLPSKWWDLHENGLPNFFGSGFSGSLFPSEISGWFRGYGPLLSHTALLEEMTAAQAKQLLHGRSLNQAPCFASCDWYWYNLRNYGGLYLR